MSVRAVMVSVVFFLGITALTLSWLVHDRDIERRLLVLPPDSVSDGSVLAQYAVPRGRVAYMRNCASCHGPQLKGSRLTGVPDLTDSDWLYGSGEAAQIEHTILYGIRSGLPRTWDLAAMPAYATAQPYSKYRIEPLTPTELDDVVTYLLSFRDRSQNAAAVARGSAVFGRKGQCYDCHSADARGDGAIGAPDLTDTVWLYGDGSRDALRESIARGRSGVCPGWRNRLPLLKIREIALFIKSMRTANASKDHAHPG